MASKVTVLVCGGINVDRFFKVNRLPHKGETLLGKSMFNGVGGKAANTAVACSKLGADTSFIGAFGDDSYTETLENALKTHNVCTQTAYRLKGSGIPCGQAYIFSLPDGDNSIIVVPAANAAWPLKLNELQMSTLKQSDCILLQREVPEIYNIRIAQVAKQYGITVMLDMGGEDTKISPQLLQFVDILSPNESELHRLIHFFLPPKMPTETGFAKFSAMKKIKKACIALQQYNKNLCVLLKRGENGALFIDGQGNVIQQQAMKVSQSAIQDTTGAGDTFLGAFAVEYIRQCKLANIWKHPASQGQPQPQNEQTRLQCIAYGMKFACVAAGLSIQTKGTIPSIPDLKDVVCTSLQHPI
mmetsp:Transcript_38549/g.63185  ORF Transcript_38549/g.63185 Transcript_38549/m.63185 type:complete len:357 (+) Transcript_38549:31-1101(+)|eukprot:CAMPEP_0202694658 /NCGR_PEP_ID=MMETSP1385-20130828/8461_1 /ASSEMBLY_ACC=CAM_ASM_000861 /TAXON_ID=933848 /ORGANISM="Elphidium margaritaceum" /LENGTH=356 /DNA_ID=CAMNT_0049350547 /DNA_START=18 /DNA_END=1088 /DNA_ORIENTATION=+